MQCCSAVENKTLLFAATWMDLEIIILRQVSQKGKDISYDIIYVCNLKKMMQMNLFTKQEQPHRLRKQTHGYERGKQWER